MPRLRWRHAPPPSSAPRPECRCDGRSGRSRCRTRSRLFRNASCTPPVRPHRRRVESIERTVFVVSDGPLLIEYCDDCARWVHPASGECRECGGSLVAREVSGRGTVFTYTVNHHPYHPEIPAPYV